VSSEPEVRYNYKQKEPAKECGVLKACGLFHSLIYILAGMDNLRHLSLLKIFSLCAASAYIDLVMAVQGAYFVPAIYDGGLSRNYGPLLLAASPIIIIIFQNYLGTASDRCTCAWGRRRPFILALTISCVLGLLIFPFTSDISKLRSDESARSRVFIVLVTTAVILVDCSASSVQVPLRAYLLDVLPQKQLVIGNIIFPSFAMLGAAVSFGVGAINWSSIFTSSVYNLNTQIKFVCGIAIMITIALTLITLCSVKEQKINYSVDRKEAIHVSNPLPLNTVSGKLESEFSDTKHFSYDDITILPYGNYVSEKVQAGRGYGGDDLNCFSKVLFNLIVGNVQFILHLSSSMVILCVACFLIVVTWYTQIYFLTHYVGEVVYDGDPFAPENSTAHQDYIKGVKVGSLVLGVSAFSGFLFLLILGPAIKLFGIRPMFVLPYVLMMIESGILIVSHNLVVVIVLSPAVYIVTVQFLTFPLMLLAMYQAKGLLLRKKWPYSDNFFGRAYALIIVSMQIAKIVSLSVNGPLMEAYGSAVSIMIFTCVLSFVGAVVACFVTIPPSIKKSSDVKGKLVITGLESKV